MGAPLFPAGRAAASPRRRGQRGRTACRYIAVGSRAYTHTFTHVARYALIRLWFQESTDARPALLGEQEVQSLFEQRLNRRVILDGNQLELLGHLRVEMPGHEPLVLAGGAMKPG